MTLTLKSIDIAYEKTKVIENLSLQINQGEFFTLLGESGCGKTTLLRCIAGFLPVANGSIHFGEQDVTHLPAHKRNIGMVFQDYALFPHLSVFENVAFGLNARKIASSEINTKVIKILERLELGGFKDRLPAALSGGQRQRVALARALVIEPSLLLMDEPLSNLDAKLRHSVRDTIKELQSDFGITTIFVTHDQEEALALSNRIAVIKKGRFEQVATPQLLYREPETSFVASFIGGANVIDLAHPQELTNETTGKLIIRTEDITLTKEATAFNGVIKSKQFLGAKTHYTVVLPSKTLLNVELNKDNHAEFQQGESVYVSFTKPFRVLAE